MLYIKSLIPNGDVSNMKKNGGKSGRQMNLSQLLAGHSDQTEFQTQRTTDARSHNLPEAAACNVIALGLCD